LDRGVGVLDLAEALWSAAIHLSNALAFKDSRNTSLRRANIVICVVEAHDNHGGDALGKDGHVMQIVDIASLRGCRATEAPAGPDHTSSTLSMQALSSDSNELVLLYKGPAKAGRARRIHVSKNSDLNICTPRSAKEHRRILDTERSEPERFWVEAAIATKERKSKTKTISILDLA
jgi:hypothetical protein